MARSKSRGKAPVVQPRSSRLVRGVLLIVVLGAAVAPSVHRGLWRWNERSEIGQAVDAVRDQGCLTCHPRATAGFLWRADGGSPQTTEVIRDALVHGRPAVSGMAGPMPAFAPRVGGGMLDRLVFGTEISAGVVDLSDEPEVRIGMTIANEMGCFDCHGPMGAGGVANPGTVGGQVPGFFGASFARQAQSQEGIQSVVRDGRSARRAWWTPWKKPPLDMPPFGDRLDSTEIALVVQAVRSLQADLNSE